MPDHDEGRPYGQAEGAPREPRKPKTGPRTSSVAQDAANAIAAHSPHVRHGVSVSRHVGPPYRGRATGGTIVLAFTAFACLYLLAHTGAALWGWRAVALAGVALLSAAVTALAWAAHKTTTGGSS